MATLIESLTGISIRSPFFSGNHTLEFFPAHNNPLKVNRTALLFGSNGSGKSTIAQGFREYVDQSTPRSVEISPMCGNAHWVLTPGSRTEKIFVFDETYVERSVKIQSSGLDAIVLFGEQVQLEQQIQTITHEIEQKTILMHQQEEDNKKYTDPNDVNSPQYWVLSITKTLQAPDGWAETAGIKIKRNRTSSRVNELEVDRLGALRPAKTEAETEAEFVQTFSVFSSIGTASQPISTQIRQITFSGDIEVNATSLLATPLQRPVLTQRESDLLDMFGMKAISDARGFLINPAYTTCPVCLQPISDEYRADTIQRIECILNREVEEFRQQLKALFMNEIPLSSYQVYSILDTTIYGQVIEKIQVLNSAISAHNAAIQAKIDDPFSALVYDNTIGLVNAYQALNSVLIQLEESRVSYNSVIASRRTTEATLLRLNNELAHYEIQDAYTSLCNQRIAQATASEAYNNLVEEIQALEIQRQQLDSQRKNFQIAADKINQSLEYIFYARGRLELELGADQLYHLKSHGQPVKPEQISCGERNALALCYYFTEIARDTDARNLYASEALLVIDDPVSSFDLENRVGILSFLRFKLSQVLSSCATTKVLIMTHDISVLLDLDKALEEVSKKCNAQGVNAEYLLFHLKDKQLVAFTNRRPPKYNEYTALLQQVYSYAQNPEPDQELVIGNMMRRVLEAFSTFSYKKGISDVSLDTNILALLPNDNSRMYFQNSMYRLVLNSESHFEEAVRGAPEASFFSHLSTTEKQRTAKDILCFIYKINELHILSHLPNAKPDLELWWTNIDSSIGST